MVTGLVSKIPSLFTFYDDLQIIVSVKLDSGLKTLQSYTKNLTPPSYREAINIRKGLTKKMEIKDRS